MKLKIEQLHLFQCLAQNWIRGKKELPSSLSFKLTRIFRKVCDELIDYNKAHDALVIKYGTPILDATTKLQTGHYDFIPPNNLKFAEEIKLLGDMEVDLAIDASLFSEDEFKCELTIPESAILEPFLKTSNPPK